MFPSSAEIGARDLYDVAPPVEVLRHLDAGIRQLVLEFLQKLFLVGVSRLKELRFPVTGNDGKLLVIVALLQGILGELREQRLDLAAEAVGPTGIEQIAPQVAEFIGVELIIFICDLFPNELGRLAAKGKKPQAPGRDRYSST